MATFWQQEGIVFRDKRSPDSPMAFCDRPARAEFQPLVESFWWMTWDLGTAVVPTEVVPSGCCNVVFEAADAMLVTMPGKVVGPLMRARAQQLTGRGRRFGVRFFPGGFASVFGVAAETWRDRVGPLAELVGDGEAEALTRAVLRAPDADAALTALEEWIRPKVPYVDARAALAMRACELIAVEKGVVTVAELCERLGVDETTLQRAFRAHVGLSPKWLLRTKRFQEAVKRVLAGESVPWADFALRHGYYDQAHFVRDFRALTGRTPTSLAPSEA